MEKKDALEFICNIPNIYNEKGNIKLIDLFIKAQKYVVDLSINEVDLINYLEGKKDKVENWLMYSWNKRSLGYGFDKNEKSGQYVFFYVDDKTHESKTIFRSMVAEEVCAVFIKRECGLMI